MEICIEDARQSSLDHVWVSSIAHLVLKGEKVPLNTELGIRLVEDEEMAQHNHRFLGKDGPTDVIALPLVAPDTGYPANPEGRGDEVPYGLGDVIIAPDYVRRQADTVGVAYEAEMALMVVHGILHLIGYDHSTDGEAAVMEAREGALLAQVGIERR